MPTPSLLSTGLAGNSSCRSCALLAAAVSLLGLASPAPGESVWVEGEDAVETDRQLQGWYDGVRKEQLSGGEWLSHYGDSPGSAGYRFSVESGGEFALWARLNPVASKPSWRLGLGEDGPWREVEFRDVRGQQNVAPGDALDHRFIGWVKLDDVVLDAGEHALSFRWEGGAQNSGALDCFLVTDEGFLPQGTLKPGEGAGEAGPDVWFPLLPGEDSFSEESVIDLSRLVPAPAGVAGVLRADGDALRFGDSPEPVKFWGVGANAQAGRFTPDQVARRAKYLRKFGVNIVRQHPLWDEVTTGGRIDPEKLDAYDRWFAELKKSGIYSCWSVFYHFTIGPDDGYPAELFDELEPQGRGGRRDTYGVITTSPELWRIRNRVMAELLDHRNPYTGLRYADDPALAVVEMNNEDSVFFWNPLGWVAEGERMPLHSQRLAAAWAEWVRARYPDNRALREAWGELRDGDSVESEALRLMGPWELPGEGPRGRFEGLDRRAGDYVKFLAELQRSNYEACRERIRETGFGGVVVTTAWQVGGAATEAANTWTDCVGDMIDRHNYFGGGAGGHGITEGEVRNGSHLARPGAGLFSMGMKQVEAKPFSVTEWTQLPPNQWKLEAAPLMAFYGLGLQGWDASFHFSQSGYSIGDGWPRMSSYVTDTPHFIGQFPALAFAVHRGHVTEGPAVAARRLGMDEVFSGRDALRQDMTQGEYDAKTIVDAGGTPAEAFAVGRVTVGFDGGEPEAADLSRWWRADDRVIESATGELVWDYGRELVTVRTAKTQGLIGKAAGRTVRLPAVSVTTETPFVSLLLTPLDDEPLERSRQVLVTALARDRQTGARYSDDGTMLESVGTAPLLLEPVQATLLLDGPAPASVRPLGPWGVPTGETVPLAGDGSFRIDGRYRAYYYEVRR